MSAETDIQFEVWQDGNLVAFSDDIPDAQHFMAVYGQDGPVEDKTAVTVRTPGFNARTPAPEGEVVGTAGAMPGTSGFTTAVFRASAVPVGTPLYASPVVPVGVSRERVLDELDKAWLHGQRRTSWRRDESADAILAALGTKATDTGREG